MAKYCCYILNKNDKIASRIIVEADDDAGALNEAAATIKASLDFPVIEVWQGTRIIGRVPQRDHIEQPS